MQLITMLMQNNKLQNVYKLATLSKTDNDNCPGVGNLRKQTNEQKSNGIWV